MLRYYMIIIIGMLYKLINLVFRFSVVKGLMKIFITERLWIPRYEQKIGK